MKFIPARVCSLDLTGTLFNFREKIGYTYHRIWSSLELTNPVPDVSTFNTAFKSGFTSTMARFPCYGYDCNMKEEQWWEYVVDSTIQSVANYDHSSFRLTDSQKKEFFNRVYDYYGTSDAYYIYPETVSFLTKLRRNGIYVVAMTNSPIRTIDDVLPVLALNPFFDLRISARQVGALKPDPRCFERVYLHAKEEIPSLRREEIVHIGNDLNEDFYGAMNAGLQSLLLDRSGKQYETIQPKEILIQDLNEALNYLQLS